MLDVADDPDNLPRAALVYRVWVVTQQNLLPDRVFVRKEAMRKRFVHDNRPRRGLCIVIIKIAPLFQRNLEGAEKARNDFVVAGTRPLVRRRFRVSQDREGVPLGEPCRKTGDGTNGFDARQRSNPFQQLFVKCIHRRRGLFHIPAGHTMHVLAAFRQLNAHGQEVARVESGIHALHAQDGVDQQARADEQHHG